MDELDVGAVTCTHQHRHLMHMSRHIEHMYEQKYSHKDFKMFALHFKTQDGKKRIVLQHFAVSFQDVSFKGHNET